MLISKFPEYFGSVYAGYLWEVQKGKKNDVFKIGGVMCWLLFIILLFPIASYAHADTFGQLEIDGFYEKYFKSNGPEKIVLPSSSSARIFGSSTYEETGQDTIRSIKRKSPTTAFILSLVGGATILPGLGQHYNGEHNKGLLMGAVWFAGWIIAARTLDTDYEKEGQIVGLPLVFAAFIWSCVDAPISANKINKRQREQNTYGHMLEFHKKQYTLGIDLNICEKTIGPNLTLHF